MSNEIHSVDISVIFKLEGGELLEIKWDDEFHCFGVGFEKIPKIMPEGRKVINVSKNQNWSKLLDKRLTGIRVLWENNEGTVTTYSGDDIIKTENRIYKLPQTWELEFEGEKVWISALEIREEESIIFWADHLSVIFTKQEQEKYELVKKADIKHCI